MNCVQKWFIYLSLISLAGCLTPFEPPDVNLKDTFLVVDGFINATAGRSEVTLSRSVPLNSEEKFARISNAMVTVVGKDGVEFSLSETTAGRYEASHPVNSGTEYFLKVVLPGGKKYQSGYVMMREAPLLDSVTWAETANELTPGITISVHGHDPANDARYYQWLYTETWEYNAQIPSAFLVENGFPRLRRFDEEVYICWRSNNSTRLLISTTNGLTNDVVSGFPLLSIPVGSKKLQRLYRLTVRQRVLDKQAYDYWVQLQKSTENLGGLFDPQPSQANGNIHSSDPNEIVLGYFMGGGIQEKTLYIEFGDLPANLRKVDNAECPIDNVLNLAFNTTAGIIGEPAPPGRGWLVSTQYCTDCRLAGGTTTKPIPWP